MEVWAQDCAYMLEVVEFSVSWLAVGSKNGGEPLAGGKRRAASSYENFSILDVF